MFFLDFLGKVYARAEVKHTIYFEWPNDKLPKIEKDGPTTGPVLLRQVSLARHNINMPMSNVIPILCSR